MTNSDDEHTVPEDRMGGLEKERRDAALANDGLKYHLLNEYLGFSPEENLIGLDKEGSEACKKNPAKVKELEKRILTTLYGEDYFARSMKASIKLEPGNTVENFGIDVKDVLKLSYETIGHIWVGMNNFYCPELCAYMNPTEILGLYAGIASKKNIVSQHMDKETVADSLSKIVSRGYDMSIRSVKEKYHDIDLPALARQLKKPSDYDATSGAMKERLELLNPELKEAIVEQLTSAPMMDVYDPNSDAIHFTKKPFKFPIENYVNALYSAYLKNNQNK
jgi:hypothetical protein